MRMYVCKRFFEIVVGLARGLKPSPVLIPIVVKPQKSRHEKKHPRLRNILTPEFNRRQFI
jgi:hypothetical protein